MSGVRSTHFWRAAKLTLFNHAALFADERVLGRAASASSTIEPAALMVSIDGVGEAAPSIRGTEGPP
jgi:hypothetical protein